MSVKKWLPLLVLLMTNPTMLHGMVEKYYDGNRPPPSEDIFSYTTSTTGITVDSFQGLYNVDLCINVQEDRAYSCFASCGVSSLSRVCKCDPDCYKYRDCCPDYEIVCIDGWPHTHANDYSTEGMVISALKVTSKMASDYILTTKLSTKNRGTIQPYYDFYNKMDLLRAYIPELTNNRPMNEDIAATCFTPSITPNISYFMVTKCPDSSPPEEHERCSSYTLGGAQSFVPVHMNGLFYANKFCANCHDHSDKTNLEFLTLSCVWSCGQNQSPYLGDEPNSVEECQKTHCFSLQWLFNPPPRACNPEAVVHCLSEDDPISRACNSYSAPVYVGVDTNLTTYKNVHCAYCNGVNETWNNCSSTKIGGIIEQLLFSDEETFGPRIQVPLTVLFDFSGGTLQQSAAYGGPQPPLDCPEYFIYNRDSHECRRVSCPSGAILQQSKCTYEKDQAYIDNHTLSGKLQPLYRRIVLDLARQDGNITDKQLLGLLDNVWNYYISVDYYSVQKYNRNLNISVKNIDLVWDGQKWTKSGKVATENDCFLKYTTGLIVTLEGQVTSSNINMECLISRLENWLKYTPSCKPAFALDVFLVRVTVANFFDVSYLCNESSAHIPKAYGEKSFLRITNNDNTNQIQMHFPGNTTEIYDSIKVPQEVFFTGGKLFSTTNNREEGNWSRMERVFLCERMPLCPLVTLKEHEYGWQIDSDDKVSLMLLKSGKIVPHSEIVFGVDGLIKVCLFFDDTYQNNQLYVYSSGQSLATTIGCVISLTLLALVIITYSSFSCLRNIPGKTVLNLSISLFIAQLLLVVAGQMANSYVCLTIAAALHFFWLAVFTWTNILAFDLGQTFGKKSSMRDDDRGDALFIKYSIYGWGIPLFIIGMSLIVHFLLAVEGAVRNIYTVTSLCWLRKGLTIMIAFGIPVAIALVVNVICITRTIHGIRSTMQMTNILKKYQEADDDLTFLKKELYLYVRLSVAVGLPWISGFIIPYVGVPELGYLFIILNSFQGPVIFLSFTCNRRVMKLWGGALRSSFSSITSMDRSSATGKTMQTKIERGGINQNNTV